MVPDLTLEVIYLNEPTDFKMEFELCSSSNVRFLSLPVKSRSEFLAAISKSVVRSRAIITVGSFNPLDKNYIPKIIAKATGYELVAVENEKLQIAAEASVILPKTALPLVDEKGNLGGCVLENNDQSIIMLTSDRELRQNIVSNLVCPYLKVFAHKKTKEVTANAVLQNVVAVAEKSVENEPKEPVLTEIEQSSAQKAEPTPEDFNISAENSDALIGETQVAEQIIPEEAPEVAEQMPETDEELTVKAAETQENAEETASLKNTEADFDKADEQQKTKLDNASQEALSKSADEPKYSVIEQPSVGGDTLFDLDGFLIDDGIDKKPKKSKKAGRVFKILISVILVLAVIVASYFGYDRVFLPMQHKSVCEDAKALYGESWSGLPKDMVAKFGKLYQANSDTFGWISLPNTEINLPVVSAAKKPTGYYLTHLFDGSASRYGTLYTTAQSNKESADKNIIIYGKNMGDGTMLSKLDSFLNLENYKQAPAFTFDTLYFESKWKIFSVFKISSKNQNGYLKTDFLDDYEFSKYLEEMQSVSAIETNIDVTYSDQIVTLVSLGEITDVVLVARKVRDGESALVDVTGATENYTVDNVSDIPVVAEPLTPIDNSSSESAVSSGEMVDQNMVDGASSRYEQKAPVTSIIEVKPTVPTITSLPETSSAKPSSSSAATSKQSSLSSKASSKPNSTANTTTTSSSVSSGSPIANKLPTLTVTNTFNGAKVKGNALDIIAQNIEAEMGSGYHIEALKAQAVAAYSWLLNNGAANNKYPSLPLKTPSQKCIDAVNAVAGQVAVYGGKVATTYYYAISAGRSAYSQDIWSSALPYLVSVDSSVDKKVKGFETTREYSAATIAQKAKNLLGIDLNAITDKTKWFTCSYDVNGIYCTKVKIGGVEKKGTYLRETFFSYDLRSSAYTIEYNENDDTFIFTVRGYGHGVGMSQTGANQYAKSGWSYDKILKHYYTGITLGTYYAG